MMKDRQKAIEHVMNFLQDESKKTLLVRGYDSAAKVKVVFSCLNKKFDKGIIRTNSIVNIAKNINKAFDKKILPHSIKSTSTYKLGKMTVNINSYTSYTKFNPTGNENTFTVYYPVQTVLDNPKRYNNFLNELDNTRSRKIILITTNEWGIKEWGIEDYMDDVFFIV